MKNFLTDYKERIKIFRKTPNSLWDVIDTCERKGSLDSETKK